MPPHMPTQCTVLNRPRMNADARLWGESMGVSEIKKQSLPATTVPINDIYQIIKIFL
jgi:hypothetical protein